MPRHHIRLCTGAALLLLAGSAASANSIYSNAVITTTNPALYWDLEETSGSTAGDLAPLAGANNGSYVNTALGNLGPQSPPYLTMEPDLNPNPDNNAPSLTAGGLGGVVYDSLSSGAGVGTNNYSAQVWFNSSIPMTGNILHYVLGRGNGTTQNTDQRDSVGVGGSYTGENVQTGKLFYFPGNGYGGGVISGTTTIADNAWYHVVLVRDGANVKVYLNGDEEINANLAWNDSGPPTLGERFVAGNRVDFLSLSLGLTGRVDEVAVWNRSLTAGDVQSLYDLSFAVPEPATGLVLAGMAGGLLARRRRD